jgi:hypothetical protein
MEIDFFKKAQEFVRRENCASAITVQLVAKAMQEGASLGVEVATAIIFSATEDAIEFRRRNIAGLNNGIPNHEKL